MLKKKTNSFFLSWQPYFVARCSYFFSRCCSFNLVAVATGKISMKQVFNIKLAYLQVSESNFV